MNMSPARCDYSHFSTEHERSQTYNPHIGRWVKRDAETVQFTDQNVDSKPI